MQVGVIRIEGMVAHVQDLHSGCVWFVPSFTLCDLFVLDAIDVVLAQNTLLH